MTDLDTQHQRLLAGLSQPGAFLPGPIAPIVQNLMARGPVNPKVLKTQLQALRAAGRGDLADLLSTWWNQLVNAASSARSSASLPQSEAAEVAEGGDDPALREEQELTSEEAAVIMDRTARHVRNMCANGTLEARRVGRFWLIDRSVVVQFVETRSAA